MNSMQDSDAKTISLTKKSLIKHLTLSLFPNKIMEILKIKYEESK